MRQGIIASGAFILFLSAGILSRPFCTSIFFASKPAVAFTDTQMRCPALLGQFEIREAIAHKKIFGHQKMSAVEAVGLFFANTARDYIAAVPRRRLLRNIAAIPSFRAAQFWGSWKGFRQDGDPTGTLKRRFYYPKGFTPKAARLPK